MNRQLRKLAMFLVISTPLSAADLAGLCDGSNALTPGQWAKYQTDQVWMNTKAERQIAIVGAKDVEGKAHFWLEFLSYMANDTMAFQFLVPAYPYSEEDIKGVAMKMGESTREYPPEMAASLSGRSDSLSEPLQRACDEAESGEMESVTVPAGTFNALKVSPHRFGKDVWISAEVPFGVVKMTESDGKGLELIAHGIDPGLVTKTTEQVPVTD